MAKVRYVVQCKRHGNESKSWDGKQVVVSKPRNSADRKNGGCPYCKAELREADAQAAPNETTLAA